VQFTIEQRFAGPLDAVEAAFVDPAFLNRLSELPKLGNPALLSQDLDGDGVHQQVRYAFTGDLSPAVRRFVDPERLTWIEDAHLDRRTHTTTWTIVPDHYTHLLRASGTFALAPDEAGGTSRRTQAEIKVSLPFVGAKVEQAIVNGLREHARLEEGVMDEWLAEQGP
jgi:hypothetical protein